MAPTLPGRKARYTITELARIVVWVGFTGTSAAQMVAIIMAESGGRTKAQHRVGSEGGRAAGSIDRGLTQINSYWHPEVSDTCAYDPYCNVSAAWRISNHGRNYRPWSTFNSGAYHDFFNAAAEAVANVGGAVSGVPINVPPPTTASNPSTLDQALDFVLGPLNWGPIGWLKSHIKAVVLAGGRYLYDALRPLIHSVGIAAGSALHLIGILEKKVRSGFHHLHIWAWRGFVDLRKWVTIGLRHVWRDLVNRTRTAVTWVNRFGRLVATFFTKAIGWVQWMVKYPPTVIVSLVADGFRRAPRALVSIVLHAMLRHAREIEDVLVRWLG